MKKLILIILVAMMMVTAVACDNSELNIGKQGRLVVNGETFQSHTTVYPEYATVSLCDVVSALGFELSWNGTDNASFICNSIKYEICISQKTLVIEGENNNYLLCAPGNPHYVCDVVEDELIIDDNTLYCLFSTYINYPVDIAVDQENNYVVISSKKF
jgi:hypothetical protein